MNLKPEWFLFQCILNLLDDDPYSYQIIKFSNFIIEKKQHLNTHRTPSKTPCLSCESSMSGKTVGNFKPNISN